MFNKGLASLLLTHCVPRRAMAHVGLCLTQDCNNFGRWLCMNAGVMHWARRQCNKLPPTASRFLYSTLARCSPPGQTAADGQHPTRPQDPDTSSAATQTHPIIYIPDERDDLLAVNGAQVTQPAIHARDVPLPFRLKQGLHHHVLVGAAVAIRLEPCCCGSQAPQLLLERFLCCCTPVQLLPRRISG